MAMDKQKILAEIKRLADANGGKSPGHRLFMRETGIGRNDWFPNLWLRWGDALAEAGYSANEFSPRISDDILIRKYADFVQELGRFPISGEMRLKSAQDKSFPGDKSFRRFGGKEKLIDALASYCRDKPEYQDIAALCEARPRPTLAESNRDGKMKVAIGCVYLMKSGRHYKIGRTSSVGRREGQLSITIPIPPKTVHVIETDDPSGVEAYWHRRFADKRGEGEWFDLSPDDVKAFKRWKRIV